MEEAGHDDPIVCLITNYAELNPENVDEIPHLPTALEFLRYVAANRPFIVRHGARDWKAVRNWDAHYLRQALSGVHVRAAVSPRGNADALIEDDEGQLLFVEPCVLDEPFDAFLDYIQHDSTLSSSERKKRNVKYGQTQNDNLRSEYALLSKDVPPDINFATEALEKDVDAVNFWLGNHRTVTSLHKDNYENIYVQVRGQKHFTLLPPVQMPCVNESPVQFGKYHPSKDNPDQLEALPNPDTYPIPVPTWDPDEPDTRPTPFSQYATPLKVTLNQGDMMYLPAMWYHKVGQGNGDEGFSCSVNYWYDMEFSGSFWSQNAFVRDVYHAKSQLLDKPALTDGG